MAKQRGLIKVEGTLEDLTFFKAKQGYLVRTKGGVEKSRILTEARFARTRENMNEFGHCAQAGKLLRKAAANLLSNSKDSLLVSRLTKTMSVIKNLDTTSVRGSRKVWVGLATPEGLATLKGFNFNENAPLSAILSAAYTVQTGPGIVEIVDLIPETNLSYPGAATHVSFTAAFMKIDFETGLYEVSESPVVNLPINQTETTVTLTPAEVPTLPAMSLFFLKVEFFQQINAVQYSLKDGGYNSLSIVDGL